MFGQETLVRVAIWCIGEYADLLVNNAGMLALEDPITVSTIIMHQGFTTVRVIPGSYNYGISFLIVFCLVVTFFCFADLLWDPHTSKKY